MIATLRHRDFALLWIGQAVSTVGNWLLFVALPFYVYSLTGSPLATGATFAASALPPLLLGSVAGVFVDRWDRQRTMVVADLLRAGLLLPLLLVRSPSLIGIVYVGVGETLTFLLGGAAAPISLFPGNLRPFAAALPFQAMLGFPAELAAGNLAVTQVLAGYALQGTWVGLFAVLAVVTWRSGVRRYLAVGV